MTWLGIIFTTLFLIALVIALGHVWPPLAILSGLWLAWLLTRRPDTSSGP